MNVAVVGVFLLLCLVMFGGALWFIRRLMGSFQDALGSEGSLDYAARRLEQAGIEHRPMGDSTLSFDRGGCMILLTTQRHRELPWYTPRSTRGRPVPRTFAHFAVRAQTGLEGVVTNDPRHFPKHARETLGYAAERSIDVPDHAHLRRFHLFAADDDRLHALHAAFSRTMSEWFALGDLLHASRIFCRFEAGSVTLSIERNLNIDSSAIPWVQGLVKVMRRPAVEPDQIIARVLATLDRILLTSRPTEDRPAPSARP